MKKLKGIIIAVILSLASILMPFNVSAAVQSVIVPTFAGDTSSWSSHLSVTNFSDGTNNQASSTLSFTFDDDYYGYVYFDGYGPSNQHIANFATVFIAGGYGEYRYSYYQNGVINITSVTIQIVNVVKPDSSVDLTQIIQLLTAIESDTSSIDLLVDQTKTQIINVLNQLVISNGYLETLTQLRQWNFPIESFTYVNNIFSLGYDVVGFRNYNYYSYPLFSINTDSVIAQPNRGAKIKNTLIFGIDWNLWAQSVFESMFDHTNQNILSFEVLYRVDNPNRFTIVKLELEYANNDTTLAPITYNGSQGARKFMPIYLNEYGSNKISIDFALNFGLSNQLLDNLNIIANGTTQSNSAASDLESGNNQMADDMDDLATIENGYNQQFNNQLQQIDFSSPLQSNSGILPAANFVITIFNGLINNNPFSVLIIVVCILLIGKKVIGK